MRYYLTRYFTEGLPPQLLGSLQERGHDPQQGWVKRILIFIFSHLFVRWGQCGALSTGWATSSGSTSSRCKWMWTRAHFSFRYQVESTQQIQHSSSLWGPRCVLQWVLQYTEAIDILLSRDPTPGPCFCLFPVPLIASGLDIVINIVSSQDIVIDI